MLEIKDLKKAYGDHPVLRGVDLSVQSGQIVGLLGANGAGKTTLISIVAGLRSADGGSVRVADIDALRDRRGAARHIGLAPQELGIYPTVTVLDNLEFFARLAGLSGGAVRRRSLEVAAALGLGESLKKKAGELSGGQKRRLHTGLAVLHKPDLMFLDEPTVGADVQSRTGILDIVRSLAAEGAAVVYTTHYLTELEQLDADIAVLYEGRVAVHGSLAEVVGRYATASVALRFDGPPPALPGWRADESTLVPIEPPSDPAAAAAGALATLGDSIHSLVGVELVRPSLETAYLAITGRALTLENDHDVVA
ncbi:ABC transporter ATP-binding protein [Micromonospora sp. NPDC047548]|uniref:ABC transporter ATP-binding protein n=1 Tax=Micromonospora sp. NPDC047548 TaxID=3155624 RepID=UPI0033CB8D31